MSAPYLEDDEDDDDYEDYDEDGGTSTENILGKDGMPRLLSAQCSTCIGRPGNQMDPRPGRVRQMVQDTIRQGGVIPCHQTLGYGGQPEFPGGAAVCRWFYDQFGTRSNLVRIYDRLGGWTEVAPPEKEGH